jgi:ELWxxDGT repeat protein
MVADIHPSGSSMPGQLRDLNGKLYFVANDGVNGSELWRSDGTEAGTEMVVDLNPAGSFPITQLSVVGDALFFVVPSGGLSAQLWRSDGTAEGTGLVASFTGNEFPIISELTDVEGTLYFSANDGVIGIELWRSDGTPEGTVLAADINPGDEWSYSYPDELTNIDGTLFFAATDGINGRELWVIRNAGSTGIPGDAESAAAPSLDLHPSFPNPFSRHTNIRFDLSSPALVRVRLFDAAGREVRDLVSERMTVGPHAVGWDGRDEKGRLVGSGVYLYRVEAGGASDAGRVVLAR